MMLDWIQKRSDMAFESGVKPENEICCRCSTVQGEGTEL